MGEGARPEHAELFKECAERMRRIEGREKLCDVLPARSVGHHLPMIHPRTLRCNLTPHLYSMFPLGIAKTDTRVISSCRIRIVQWSCCYAAAIGVASEHADLRRFNADCHQIRSGGFARLQHCWGLHFYEKKLFSEGSVVGTVPALSNAGEWLLGRVLRLELNKHSGSLCFFREDSTGDVELGTITAPFKEQGELFFTASACCNVCEFELLDLV